MCDDAVACHLRRDDPKSAVDCCVNLNVWDKALELAEKYDYPQVEGLLQKVRGRACVALSRDVMC